MHVSGRGNILEGLDGEMDLVLKLKIKACLLPDPLGIKYNNCRLAGLSQRFELFSV
jgi:hypothetical protein